MELSLLEHFLPPGLLNYFNATKMDIGDGITIYLDEKNVAPSGSNASSLESKGFTEPTIVQDFPIRDKACYLSIRRRKWLNKETGKVLSNHWDLAAQGTRMTKELADFLKERPGYYTG